MTEILIWLFSILAMVASVLMVITRRILYGAYSLVICLISLAALYVLLQAEFVGVTQLMIYVGGIIILILFAIMLTNKLKGEALVTRHYNRFLAAFLFLSTTGLLGWLIQQLNFEAFPDRNMTDTMHETGIYLMTIYLLPMEIVAVLLLLVLIGAINIAGENFKKEGAQ